MSLLASAVIILSANPATVPVPVEGEWWSTRHEAMVERLQKPADLVFIGDSITHSFGGEPNTHEDFAGRGQDSWQLFYGDRRAANLGISGDRTENVLWRLERYPQFNPKVAVIMIGTNNVGHNTPTQIAEGVQAVVHQVQTKAPKAKILLLGIFPRDKAGSPARQAVTETNRILEGWAKTHRTTFLDIAPAFLDSNGEIPTEVMPDGLHPMALGFRKWAMAMEPTLAKLLGQKPKTTLDPINSAVVPVTQRRDFPLYDWLPRHQCLLEWPDRKQAQIAFIGDSITHRWGGQPLDPTDNTPRTGLEPWQEFFGKWKPINMGYGWDRTENVLWRLEQGELDRLSPKAVVLLIGTNNIFLNTNLEIRDGVQAILSLVHAKCPSAKILLLGVLPRGAQPDDAGRMAATQLNVLLKQIRRPYVKFADFGPRLLEPDGTIRPETMFDFLHPTQAGYAKLAPQIRNTVAPWMK